MSKHKEKTSQYKYPSRFGSHASMLVTEQEGSELVVCEDEFGEFTTLRSRLDNGLSDPNRCAEARLSKLFQGKKKEKE